MLNKITASTETEISLDSIDFSFLNTASSYEEIELGLTELSDLAKPTIITKLRNTILEYTTAHHIDGIQHGFRLIIDIPQNCWGIKAYITDKPVAAQNFSDWLTPKADWKPGLGQGEGGFFEKCAITALQSPDTLINGAPIEFLNAEDKTVFAVQDGSPKTPFHYLIMTTAPRANILDNNFTLEEWHKTFELAYKLLKEKTNPEDQYRLIFNAGPGNQRGARHTVHVQADNDLLSFDPEELGYILDKENYCILFDSNTDIDVYLKEIITKFKQATTIAENIQFGQELKRFIRSREKFH
jgi:hypothetical protein